MRPDRGTPPLAATGSKGGIPCQCAAPRARPARTGPGALRPGPVAAARGLPPPAGIDRPASGAGFGPRAARRRCPVAAPASSCCGSGPTGSGSARRPRPSTTLAFRPAGRC
ncbi:hypothetical protein G6F35_018030 [Rhizopus arrhizus]|nr:hypothetical protein G6F35_018030 [Rhizopus arrhizus]